MAHKNLWQGKQDRGDIVRKCYKTLWAMMDENGVTAKELQLILNCSLKTAYRYIREAERVLKVNRSKKYPRSFVIDVPLRIDGVKQKGE